MHAPTAALQPTAAAVHQVLCPVAVSLLTRLRGLASARLALGSAAAPPQQQQRRLHFGAAPSRVRSGLRRRPMEESFSPKSPSARRAEDIMASAFLSPKRSGMSSMPASGAMMPPLAGVEASAAAPAARGPSPPHAAAATAVPPLNLAPLNMSTQPSATDLMDEQIILDPNTPRSPKHQAAEQLLTSGKAGQVLKRHMDAVVKVFATHSKPNFSLPWQRQQQVASKSTGFAVKTDAGERYLLTNAHSVSYNTQVQLKRRGDDEKYCARVLAIGTECDVALLTVEDERFWEDIVPLELGDLPALQEAVAVVGYPIGGDSLAISAGVVSRVQMTHYSHGCMSLLAVQTDAAINSGNSGGPVMNARGECVGIAFQSMTGDIQSVGYVIPTSVVRHFLADYSRSKAYKGFPSLNIVWQEMDSKALKRAYGMAPHQKGVLVRSVTPASDEAASLRADDILLAIDGVALGNDGTVPFRHGERVDFKYLITNKHVGDTASLRVLRDGQEQTIEVKLSQYQHLVPPHLRESKPSYFITGGLVFTSCSDPYLIQRYGSLGGAPVRLIGKTYFGTRQEADEQVVLLSSVLACDATMGYEATLGIKDSPVTHFNGHKVSNLAQLARLVLGCADEYLRFSLEAANKVVVVERAVAERCTPQILEDHNISRASSSDIQAKVAAFERAPVTAGPASPAKPAPASPEKPGEAANGEEAVPPTPAK